MIDRRQPRFPRVSYNRLDSFMQPQLPEKLPIRVNIEFDQDIIRISKRTLSKISKANEKGNIRIQKRQWEDLEMSQICKNIQKWDIPKGLYINYTRRPQLLKQISAIRFETLTNLNLSYNTMETLQPLSKIELPNLQQLSISHNNITCIKSIRKANFPKLHSCSLGSNKILQYHYLCELNIPIVRKIYQEHRADPGWCGSFNWIAKMETDQLQGLWVSSDNRIWQKSAQTSFERKYIKRKQITFYVSVLNNVA